MKKGLITIFSLSLLLSVSQSALGECTKGQTWGKRSGVSVCTKKRRLPDAKESTYRLASAGMIATIALVADPAFKKAIGMECMKWMTDKMPDMLMNNSDYIAKALAVVAAAAGGAWILKNKLAKKILTLF